MQHQPFQQVISYESSGAYNVQSQHMYQGALELKDRSCSAPAKFDSQSLFLYQENDHFVSNFNKGFIGVRMDPQYTQFYMMNKQKNYSLDRSSNSKDNDIGKSGSENNQKGGNILLSQNQNNNNSNNLPAPIHAQDEVELMNQLKLENNLQKMELLVDQNLQKSVQQRTQNNQQVAGIEQLANGGGGNSALNQLGEFNNQSNLTPYHLKSSDSNHSSSPGIQKSGGKERIREQQNPTTANIMKRRQRLSTISSEMIDDVNESPQQSFKRRRKSSTFEMLSDPYKYQETVLKFLDGIEEEEEGKNQTRGRKRTRSSNYLKNASFQMNKLHDIDEEYEELNGTNNYTSDELKQIIAASQNNQKQATNFIKDSIQSYSLNNKEPNQQIQQQKQQVHPIIYQQQQQLQQLQQQSLQQQQQHIQAEQNDQFQQQTQHYQYQLDTEETISPKISSKQNNIFYNNLNLGNQQQQQQQQQYQQDIMKLNSQDMYHQQLLMSNQQQQYQNSHQQIQLQQQQFINDQNIKSQNSYSQQQQSQQSQDKNLSQPSPFKSNKKYKQNQQDNYSTPQKQQQLVSSANVSPYKQNNTNNSNSAGGGANSSGFNQKSYQQQQQQQQSASKNDHLTVAQIAKKFNLVSTFETLEGHEKLAEKEMKALLEYSNALSRDQGGCRFLQKKIEENNPELIDIIFDSTIEYYMELMNDPFGNYLTQKLTESCRSSQLTAIIQKVQDDPVNLCRNAHGTRSIQKIIEVVKEPLQIKMLSDYLKGRVRDLAEDINGNHVIQKILSSWGPEHNQFIYDAMINQCVEIACHKHGCCVMQKCIDGAEKKTQRMELITKIAEHTQTFVKNPFGNYVVQYVLELKEVEINKLIGKRLLGSLLSLGKEKFSSNVIEKCLEHNSSEIKEAMVREIMAADSFYEFLIDQYGNYVIQKSLSVAQEPYFTQFIEKLKPDLEQLKYSNDFGIKIYNRLIKQYPQLCTETSANGNKQYKQNSQYKGGNKNGQKNKNQNGETRPKKNKKKDSNKQTIVGGGVNSNSPQHFMKSQSYQEPSSTPVVGGEDLSSAQGYDMYYNQISFNGKNSTGMLPQNNFNINININQYQTTAIKTNNVTFAPQYKDQYFNIKTQNYYGQQDYNGTGGGGNGVNNVNGMPYYQQQNIDNSSYYQKSGRKGGPGGGRSNY